MNRIRRILTLAFLIPAALIAPAGISGAPSPTDEEAPAADIYRVEQRDSIRVAPLSPTDSIPFVSLSSSTSVTFRSDSLSWWRKLIANNFDFKDSTIVYPKFAGFCVKVYNWADKFFNSYDPEYVQSTGRRWKAYIKNDNWLDSYAMNFNSKMNMRMMSDVTCNLGPYIQYMAVSVGYMWDMSNIIGGQPQNRKRFDFGFSCARFSADLFYWTNTGGNIIRTFGKYNRGKLIHLEMPGVKISSFGVDLYYFINNRKYSQVAAYGYGKIQKKSHGSIIVGFTYGNQNINLDFRTLPAVLVPYLTIAQKDYTFHYYNYCAMIGYGYNWVMSPHFLFNVTLVPCIGINRCLEDSIEGNATLLSLNLRGRFALVYNYKDFFAGINGKIDGHWYRSDNYSLFNAMETLSASIGWRF